MLFQTKVNKFVWLFSLPPLARLDSARPQTTATPAGYHAAHQVVWVVALHRASPPAGPRNINLYVLPFPPQELA